MKRGQAINRLRLGPIVGHTDAESTRVWIQVRDDPAHYSLRIQGVGAFRFVSTEPVVEFGTAIATARSLRPDRIYRYQVFRRGRFVPLTRGSFRTMPADDSMAEVQFAVISCNSMEELGAWEQLARFIDEAQPRFLIMMGDQVYIDDDDPDVFKNHLSSPSPRRREAIAEKYQLNWSREPVRSVLANIPTYMIWDDHDIRDGWGSFAPCSPTLARRHSRGRPIFDEFNAFFEDTRDAYWHFQGCHNPTEAVLPALPNYINSPPQRGVDSRRAMPYVFRCGRMLILVLDSRGERDVFREEYPILGPEQWSFIEDIFANLPDEIDGIGIVTATPIASPDPEGQAMKLFGDRTDDVEMFKDGDRRSLLNLSGNSIPLDAIASVHVSALLGRQVNLGAFKQGAIDEARDQWSHKFSRPEQIDLIRKAGEARLTNRSSVNARNVIFLAGDIHTGGIFKISVNKPKFTAPLLISSGISNRLKGIESNIPLGIILDEEFTVGPGIKSSLQQLANTFNFGVVQVIPTGAGAKILGTVVHEGSSFGAGIDVGILLQTPGLQLPNLIG